MIHVPTFITNRLKLVPTGLQYAEAYEALFNDWTVIGNLGKVVPWPYPKGGAHDYFQNVILPNQGKSVWSWVILLHDETLIGSVSLRYNDEMGHRGFWLGEPFRKQGYMQEAIVPITDFAFEALRINPLILKNARQNKASSSIKKLQNATLMGLEPSVFNHPDYTESEVWHLTPELWSNSDLKKTTTYQQS